MSQDAARLPAVLDRRFEAVAFAWEETAVPDRGADTASLRALVEEACERGLELAILSDGDLAEVDQQLAARPSGPGGLTLLRNRGSEFFRVEEPGVHLVSRRVATAEEGLTGESDAVRWLLNHLWNRGVAPQQILLVGKELGPLGGLCGRGSPVLVDEASWATVISVSDEPAGVPDGVVAVGGGPATLAVVLSDQIARRRRCEPPVVAPDADWTLRVDGVDPLLERVHESLLTVADGRLGTRGSILVPHAADDPSVLLSGIYAGSGPDAQLLGAPRWNSVGLAEQADLQPRRVLDLHSGTLTQRLSGRETHVDAVLFSSLARPETAVLRVRAGGTAVPSAGALQAPPETVTQTGTCDGCAWTRVTSAPGSVVAAASEDIVREGPSEWRLDRIASYHGSNGSVADERVAVAHLRAAHDLGFEALLNEHRRAWAVRWSNADVRIDGDPELQRAVRFALFHLMASVASDGEAAVGARGLSGGAYRGHVFWDADVFVLPFLAATHPPAARAMLEYRVRRLPAAVRAARLQRRRGARFAWESTATGEDVTPHEGRNQRGELVAIRTSELEEHIVADVAWAAAHYIDWTGDRDFAAGPGRELLVQTARWWASRIELDGDGRGHISNVIGPDEYHEAVNDNAYTNVMARWNLRRAAAATSSGGIGDAERRSWLDLADAITDGYDAETGLYEQFAGFFALEPLIIAQLAPSRPVAADVLLGAERTRAAQVIKQADALMLHYLVPGEVAPGSLAANLDYYEPRTTHGSTLSPGVHAALLARAGRLEEARDLLRLTARIDLDDIGQLTAGGLHLAAMGSVWRALAFGVAGLVPTETALAVDPVRIPGVEAYELTVRFQGSRVRLRVGTDRFAMQADQQTRIRLPTGETVQLGPTTQTFALPDTR